MQLLFVCTGNICRSPIAERLAAAWSAEVGITDLTVSSAGTHAVIGSSMEPNAAQVLSDLGGTPDGFTARQLTPTIAGDADLILTMTQSHRDRVLRMAPRQLRRTFTLREAAVLAATAGPATIAELAKARGTVPGAEDADVPDPMGRSAATFENVGSLISEALIENFLPRLSL